MRQSAASVIDGGAAGSPGSTSSQSFSSPQHAAESAEELWEFLSTWDDTPLDFELPGSALDTRRPPRRPSDPVVAILKPRGTQRPKYPSTHARQQAEMSALKQEAQALSKTLKQLREGQRSLKPWTPSATHQHPLLVARGADTWRQTAARERDRLHSALCDNTRLRLRVLEEKKLLKKMKQMILTRAAKYASLAKKAELMEPCLELPLALQMDDSALFCQLVADLDAMHASAGETLDRFRLAESRRPAAKSPNSWNVRVELSEFIGAEVTASTEVPFRKSDVERAMRVVHFQRKSEHDFFDAAAFGGSSDTAVQKWVARVHIASGSGFGSAHKVYRTAIREPHSQAMSAAFVALTGALSSPATGFVVSHQTSRFFTASEGGGRQREESTLIRTFSTLRVVSVQEPSAADWEKAFVETTLLPFWKGALAFGDQLLLNALMNNRQTALVRADAL